jgi:peroxiredoxin
MKKLLFILVLAPFVSSAQDGKTFKIKGKLSKLKMEPEWVFLSYKKTDGNYANDSVKISNSRFSFTGLTAEPQSARLRVKYKVPETEKPVALNFRRDMATVFIEPGTIKVSSVDSFSNIKVKGSDAHAEFVKLQKQNKPFDDKLEPLYKKYGEFAKAKDKESQGKVEKEIDAISADRKETVYGAYLRNNASSPIAMYAMNQYAGWDIDADKVEPVFNSLPEATRSLPSAVEFKEKIEVAKKTGVGKIAMDFTQNDTIGQPVSLSSLRGKYLLIDFWASWCGPCRAENPNLVKAYAKFREKGFHIIGVSLDNPGQKEKWMKAIHDDGLYWTQVSDLKGWKNEVSVMYGIQAIPQNLLLDPEGMIIAKNLRGEELDSKLAEFVEKKGF